MSRCLNCRQEKPNHHENCPVSINRAKASAKFMELSERPEVKDFIKSKTIAL